MWWPSTIALPSQSSLCQPGSRGPPDTARTMFAYGDTIILGIRYGKHVPSHGSVRQRQSVLRALARQDAMLRAEIAHAEAAHNPYRTIFPFSWTDPISALLVRLCSSLLFSGATMLTRSPCCRH